MDQDLTECLKDLYKVQRSIDELNDKKTRLKKDVEELIVENGFEGKKFSIGDRCISYSLKTTTQPLTQRYLAASLEDYYQRQGSPEEAESVLKYVLENRQRTQKYQLDMTKQKRSK